MFLFSQVVDHPTTMLPESTLTVLCEIGGFKRITNRSDYQRVRENFDCDNLPALKQDMTKVRKEKKIKREIGEEKSNPTGLFKPTSVTNWRKKL